MARSFWGFGYNQPDDKGKNMGNAMPPPNGAFAAPTTAVSSATQNYAPHRQGSAQAAAQAAYHTTQGDYGNGSNAGGFGENQNMGGNANMGGHVADNSNQSFYGAGAASAFGASSALTRSGALSGPGGRTGNINIPATAQIQGKLRVRVVEARGLPHVNAQSNPYVVVMCSTSEHISRSATNAGGTPSIGGTTSSGSGIAIPNSRTSSRSQSSKSQPASRAASLSQPNTAGEPMDPANPRWQDEAIFDVTSYNSDLEITVYDAGNNDTCIGHVKIRPDFQQTKNFDEWYPITTSMGGRYAANPAGGENAGENAAAPNGEPKLHISMRFEHTSHQHFGPKDFMVLRLIGKGTFGQVYQVRKRDSGRVYAMKVLSKRVIVREKEIAHTIGERDILVRTSGEGSAFLVGLKFSFQTSSDLYLVTDYMSGGELFWHLQREGRFSEQRAKYYIAELIVALEHLHDNHIVYRDLKPENILLDASGHIALCDFGLSKANLNNGTTNTFCGTTEYLAPEVLLDDKGYTKMVDFWSLGVLIFEMCCGWSPFYAEDNQQMYKNIAFGKVRFPKDALSPEGRDFVKGLLNRNPKHRLGATNDARELMAHPFFRDIDWDMLKKKQIPPPYKPHVTSEDDTSNFDPEFTSASTSVLTRNMEAGAGGATPLSPGIQDKFKGFTFVDDTLVDEYLRSSGARNTPGSQGQTAPISSSFRPIMPPKMGRDEGIDLYDDQDIKLSHSHYDSGIKHKFANARPEDDKEDMMRMDEEDEDMMDDDREASYSDFVEGQGFEM